MSKPSSASELAEKLTQARPSDPVELLIDQARIAGTLFGTDPAVGLGRFRILERLGSGSMGVVYAAYDPELNRGVALKIVRSSTRGRAAMLSEAQALARLSHPNVVPVYDVGVAGECVYIVMELVRGETLRRWVAGRNRREVLDAYRQAGAALAAAHSAGLVHRDFKPDNAVVGRDGRVRVVDFGLACEATDPSDGITRPPVIAGTPRYMAPEQAAGQPVTPAADQYSFCVALREALAGGDPDRPPPPLPRWIAAAITRGTASDPAERFATMGELLGALARDPARIWRRGVVLGAVVGVVGVAAYLGGTAHGAAHLGGTKHGETCRGGEQKLATAWIPSARASALARIASLGPYGRRLAPELEGALRDHATRWVAGHRDACLAHERGEQSAELLAKRMECLERGRAALAEFAEIASRADATSLPRLRRAVVEIPEPEPCADIDWLRSEPAAPPPALRKQVSQLRDDLQQTQIQLAAGRATEARATAALYVLEARELGYAPLLVEALLVEGQADIELSDRVAAVPVLREATDLAVAIGADRFVVEAWARWAWALGTETDPQRALDELHFAESFAKRKSTNKFARALLYNNIGSIELGLEHRDRAKAALERALVESRGVKGPGEAEVMGVLSNLALVTDDRAASDALLSEAIADRERLLGPDHPDTLEIRMVRGVLTIPMARAATLLTEVCDQYKLHPHAPNAVLCWTELGFVRGELGELTLAIEAMQHARDLGADDEDVLEAIPYLMLWRGDAEGAARQLTDVLAAPPPGPNAPWWERLARAQRELALGRARRVLGDHQGARQILASSVDRLSVIARNHPGGEERRRLGRAQAELAKTLSVLDESKPQRLEAATAAAAWLREAEGTTAEIAELERIASAP